MPKCCCPEVAPGRIRRASMGQSRSGRPMRALRPHRQAPESRCGLDFLAVALQASDTWALVMPSVGVVCEALPLVQYRQSVAASIAVGTTDGDRATAAASSRAPTPPSQRTNKHLATGYACPKTPSTCRAEDPSGLSLSLPSRRDRRGRATDGIGNPCHGLRAPVIASRITRKQRRRVSAESSLPRFRRLRSESAPRGPQPGCPGAPGTVGRGAKYHGAVHREPNRTPDVETPDRCPRPGLAGHDPVPFGPGQPRPRHRGPTG